MVSTPTELRVMKDRYTEFYKSYDWRKVRYDALKAGDGKCQLCGRGRHDGIILNVDHIISLRTNWKLRADLSNLQVLCNECNHGKGNRDSTDWRAFEPVERTKTRKARRRRKKKIHKVAAKKKDAIDRWKYGKMGAASGVRVVSLDDWIADKIKEAQ